MVAFLVMVGRVVVGRRVVGGAGVIAVDADPDVEVQPVMADSSPASATNTAMHGERGDSDLWIRGSLPTSRESLRLTRLHALPRPYDGGRSRFTSPRFRMRP